MDVGYENYPKNLRKSCTKQVFFSKVLDFFFGWWIVRSRIFFEMSLGKYGFHPQIGSQCLGARVSGFKTPTTGIFHVQWLAMGPNVQDHLISACFQKNSSTRNQKTLWSYFHLVPIKNAGHPSDYIYIIYYNNLIHVYIYISLYYLYHHPRCFSIFSPPKIGPDTSHHHVQLEQRSGGTANLGWGNLRAVQWQGKATDAHAAASDETSKVKLVDTWAQQPVDLSRNGLWK